MKRALLLFVYGTLKRGLANHFWLKDAAFMGDARTTPSFRLLDLGAYPALAAEGDRAITGELYAVDQALLAKLDTFEGAEYARRTISLEDGREAQAYLLALSSESRAPFNGDSWPSR